jgi:hypothetical protein
MNVDQTAYMEVAETCSSIRCVYYTLIHVCAFVGFDIISNFSMHVMGHLKYAWCRVL